MQFLRFWLFLEPIFLRTGCLLDLWLHRLVVQIARYHLKGPFLNSRCRFSVKTHSKMQYILIFTFMAIFGPDYWMIWRFSGPAVFRSCSLGPKLSFQAKICWLDDLDLSKNPSEIAKSAKTGFRDFWMIQIFFGKSGSVAVPNSYPSNIWPSLMKILRAVIRENGWLPTN